MMFIDFHSIGKDALLIGELAEVMVTNTDVNTCEVIVAAVVL